MTRPRMVTIVGLVLPFIILIIWGAAGGGTAVPGAFETIRETLGREGLYQGCPKCRDLFETAFQEVEKGSPQWEQLVGYRTGCLMDEHREIEAANLLREALALVPDNPDFYTNLGTAYLRLGDHKNAEVNFQKANAVKPGYEATYKLAVIHLMMAAKAGQQDGASTQESGGLLARAEEEINQAIGIYKGHGTSPSLREIGNWSLLANIYAQQRRMEKAAGLWRELIDKVENGAEWDPEHKGFFLTEARFSLGSLEFRRGNREGGRRLMEEAIDTAPTQDLKRHKKILLDILENPPGNREALEKRYPQLKEEGSFIPLY